MLKKYIAQLLAVAILLASIPLDAIASVIVPQEMSVSDGDAASFASAATATASKITEMGLSVGQGLIDASVSGGDSIANRGATGWTQEDDAWSYGMPKSGWSWWRGTASDVTYSADVSSGNTLSFSAYKTDNVILLPKLPSTNYKFEATFTVGGEADPNGSFGLVTNIAPTYTESIGGTMFIAYAAGHSSGEANKVYTRNKCSKENGQQAANTYVPTGYTAPGAGDSLTLTVYAYEGTNYYYIDGNYVASLESIFTTEGESLCGFFCSGNTDTTVTITNISIRELVPAPKLPSEILNLGLTIGDDLINTEVCAGYDIPHHEELDWVQNADEWSYGMPKGKDSNGSYNWGWWRQTSGSYSAGVTSYNTISLSAGGTDSIILLPTLPSTNYKFEATFTVEGNTDPNGSFGLITNIEPTYAESIGGTMFVAYAAGHNSGAKNRVYTRNKATKTYIGEELYESSNTIYTPAGYTAPGAGDSATLTVYTYEGKNYYYINDIYVGTINSKLTTEGESLCGFFCSGNDETTVSITNISVKKLVISGNDTTGGEGDTTGDQDETGAEDEIPEGLDFDGTYTLGEVLLETDFENTEVGQLPEGWQKGAKASGLSFGYTASQSAASMTGEVTTLEGYGNVLHFSSNLTDAYITTPDTGTMDYLFEADIVVNFNTEGEFGLANNFYAGVNDADGCMYNSSYIAATGTEKKESTWKYRTANGSTMGTWAASYYPKKGDVVNLKILSYKGYNYVYWNDILCAIAQQRGVTSGGETTSDNPGFFTYGGDIYVTDVKVTRIYYDKAEIAIDNAALSVGDNGEVGIDVNLSFDKTQEIYSKYVTGAYNYSDSADLKFGVLVAVGDSQIVQEIDEGTAGVSNTVFTSYTQDDSKIGFVYSITDIRKENIDKFYTIRPYCLVQDAYYYGESKAYSAAALANGIYAFTEDEELKDSLADIFADSEVFVGKEAASLTFTLFSDFHYKENMYATTIADLMSILERADTSDSAFVMSAGDFCNDALGSPELFNTYLNYYTEEGELLPAYNIYGNHELESANNSMEVVTPLLTNSKVVWGTADGSYDASVAYYYFESNGFRIVCTDNNYSWNPTGEYWEHNRTKSYGAPTGNTNTYSLGPDQLAWLETVLTDAARQDIPCIIVEHSTSSDVSAIYKKVNDINPGTVLMCISGHTHTNVQEMDDGVFHLVTNTTRNGEWESGGAAHYTDEHTFMYEEYDSEGNLIGTYEKSLGSLKQGANTWFFADPLSAVITINEYGVITIDGYESTWAYDIIPSTAGGTTEPRISSGIYWSCDLLGHNMVYHSDDKYHWTDECTNTLCNAVNGQAAHTYDQQVADDEYFAADATCGAGVTYYYSCVCGKAGTETFEAGEPDKQHTYGEWTVVKEATADETGRKEKVCYVCGDVQSEVIPVNIEDASESEDIPNTSESGDIPNTSESEDIPNTSESQNTSNTTENDTDSSEIETAHENYGDASGTEAAQVINEGTPNTGDDSNHVLWFLIVIVSGTVLFTFAVYCRRKRK